MPSGDVRVYPPSQVTIELRLTTRERNCGRLLQGRLAQIVACRGHRHRGDQHLCHVAFAIRASSDPAGGPPRTALGAGDHATPLFRSRLAYKRCSLSRQMSLLSIASMRHVPPAVAAGEAKRRNFAASTAEHRARGVMASGHRANSSCARVGERGIALTALDAAAPEEWANGLQSNLHHLTRRRPWCICRCQKSEQLLGDIAINLRAMTLHGRPGDGRLKHRS